MKKRAVLEIAVGHPLSGHFTHTFVQEIMGRYNPVLKIKRAAVRGPDASLGRLEPTRGLPHSNDDVLLLAATADLGTPPLELGARDAGKAKTAVVVRFD